MEKTDKTVNVSHRRVSIHTYEYFASSAQPGSATTMNPMIDSNLRPVSLQRQVFDAAERSFQELKALIEVEKVPITITNGAGQTLAHIAAKCGNVDVIKYVLEREPTLLHKKDAYNVSILHLATVKGSLAVVKYLVEVHNAEICFLGGLYNDRTALHAAVEFNHLDILKYFVEERNIDVDVPDPRQTVPPIFLAVKRRSWDVIHYLIEEKKAKVKMLNSQEENILFGAVRENFLSLIEYLLDDRKIDFDVNWKNYYGETVVHVAANYGRLEMLDYLVNMKSADINVQKHTDKRTPLHYAAFRNKYEACKFLIQHGADPCLEDTSGDIAADKARDRRVAEYLENVAKSRYPRSVASADSSIESAPAPQPAIESIQQRSIGQHSQAVAYAGGEDSSFSYGTAHVSYVQGFLFLAKSLMKSARRENPTAPFPSPSSIVQSRMSSIAIDVIDAQADFQKF